MVGTSRAKGKEFFLTSLVPRVGLREAFSRRHGAGLDQKTKHRESETGAPAIHGRRMLSGVLARFVPRPVRVVGANGANLARNGS